MFGEKLEIALTLTVGGAKHTIRGGNVRRVDLSMASYGFSGAIEFVVADDAAYDGGRADKLLADFQKPALMEVSVSVKTVYRGPDTAARIAPLSVAGIVTTRDLEEGVDRTAQDRAIYWRRYRVEFADPARVLWSQHFPCALYTGKSLTNVFDDHKGSKIALTYDGAGWSKIWPLVFLNLVPDRGASFYDFVHWFTDARAAVFSYDYAAAGYTLRAAKDAAGAAAQLLGDDVARVRVHFPEVPRHEPHVVNSYAAAQTNTAVDNAHALDALRHDHLLRSPVAKDATDRVTTEKSRLATRAFELRLEFGRWPSTAVPPGTLLAFDAANLWPESALQMGKTWRVRRLDLRARAERQGPDADLDATETAFEVDVRSELEQVGETWVERPPFVRPAWPAHVEGTVVSETGAADELTYEYQTNKDTSLHEYKVKVPVFADQIIAVPYDPHRGSGKMYVPIYKGARVLVAMDLFEASIARALDWRDGALMAMDVQGERLFFGKKSAAGTTMDHKYDDAKPVFVIARTHEKDTGTITISEGSLCIQVKETS